MIKNQTNNQVNDISPAEARNHLKNNMGIIISNIKNFMLEKKVNQKELAFRINSEQGHVSNMLKNDFFKNGLTINVLGRIAKALEVKLEDLVKQPNLVN